MSLPIPSQFPAGMSVSDPAFRQKLNDLLALSARVASFEIGSGLVGEVRADGITIAAAPRQEFKRLTNAFIAYASTVSGGPGSQSANCSYVYKVELLAGTNAFQLLATASPDKPRVQNIEYFTPGSQTPCICYYGSAGLKLYEVVEERPNGLTGTVARVEHIAYSTATGVLSMSNAAMAVREGLIAAAGATSGATIIEFAECDTNPTLAQIAWFLG